MAILLTYIVNEGFEATGYENTWAETVDAGCTLDADATYEGLPDPRNGGDEFGFYLLKAEVVNATSCDAYAKFDYGQTYDYSYQSFYLYIAAEGLGNGNYVIVSRWDNASDNVVLSFRLEQRSGTLYLYTMRYDNGSVRGGYDTTGAEVTTGTWYHVEGEYNRSTDEYSWKLDGTEIHSNALNGTLRKAQKWCIGCYGNQGAGTTTIYIDEARWANAWVGTQLEFNDGVTVGESAGGRTITKVLADGATAGDTTATTVTKILSDGAQVGDSISNQPTKGLSDGVVVGDATTNSVTKVLSDGAQVGDSISNQPTKGLSDGVVVGDATTNSVTKVLSDGVQVADTIARTLTLKLSDGVKIVESAVRVWVRETTVSPWTGAVRGPYNLLTWAGLQIASKVSTTWSTVSDAVTSWTSKSKPSSSFTKVSKPTTTWSEG